MMSVRRINRDPPSFVPTVRRDRSLPLPRPPLDLSARHSHLYPGARGHLDGPPRDGPVTLAFADGTRVSGRLDGDRLSLEAHLTAKGTAIEPKSWRIAFGPAGAGGRVPFRIAARL
jgi:hypothetical protein